MKAHLISLCLIAFTILIQEAKAAEELKLTWDFPKMRSNGKALTVDELAYTTVIWICFGKEGSRNVPAPQNYTLVGVPGPGECVYQLTVTDKNGLISERTAPYEWIQPITDPDAQPNPPNNLSGALDSSL